MLSSVYQFRVWECSFVQRNQEIEMSTPTIPRTDDSHKVPLVGLLHLLVLYLAWGSTYLAIRVAVQGDTGFEPFTLGVIRLAAASVLIFLIAFLRRRQIKPTRGELQVLLISGLLMWVGGNGLVNWAEQRADSGYAALIVGALPLWTSLIESVIDKRLPSIRLTAGLLVGFGGLAVLTLPEIQSGAHHDVLAVVALLVAPLAWGIGMVLMARKPVRLGPLATAGWQQLFGLGGFAIVALLVREQWSMPSAAAWGAVGYLVLAGSVLAITSLMAVLRLLPTTLVSTYAFVNPVVAVFLGWLLLSESVTLNTIIGAVLVFAGVAGVFDDRRHRQHQAITLKNETGAASDA